MAEKVIPDTWKKTASISAGIGLIFLGISIEKIDAVNEIYNKLVDYGAHGWAVLGLIFFALRNQWLAIGATTRVENLKEAQRNLNETNDALKNSLASWKNFVTANVNINNTSSTQNAWIVLYWAARNQKVLQEIADTYKEEIKKGQ